MGLSTIDMRICCCCEWWTWWDFFDDGLALFFGVNGVAPNTGQYYLSQLPLCDDDVAP